MFRLETQRRAHEYARPMFWPNVGRKYSDFFGQIASAADRRPDRGCEQVFAMPCTMDSLSQLRRESI